MKMYRETFKRLSPIGLALAIATLIYTIITGGQDCFGESTRSYSTSAIGMTPVLLYYAFSAVIFGMYGFSFLFKRSASDAYHSLPVTRTDLYLSTTLATATWMGGTIVLNVLCMLGMQLIGGCPFVPAYVPLSIAYFFVASMIIYAATAIGCALSGTYLTALASTGIVLFLPRFIQFIIARGVVDKTSIIGWLDLGMWLNPMTNVATGMVVMQSRSLFEPFAVQWPYILYSLLPMAAGLVVGWLLFLRRPSEAAEHGTSRKLWPLVTATLLAVAAMAMITVNNQALISVVGAAIVAVAFLIFVVYQVVAARTVKQILLSLPCLLLAGALAYGVSLGTGQAVQSMLNVTPKPDEIASVTFRGHDYKLGTPEYVTLLLNRISYTDDEMKKYISSSLSDAVDRVNDPRNAAYDEYSQYQMIEPITLKLTNGQTVDRTILFKNIDTLNELREKDSAYQTAIRSFPDQANMQYLYVNRNFTDAECQAIWDSLKTEAKALNLVTNDYYRKQSETDTLDPSGYSYQRGNAQVLISLSYGGYVGDRRFVDYNTSVRMETPKTAALLMKTYNKYMKPDTIARMREAIKHISSPLALENDSVNISLTFFNVPRTGGEPAQIPINLYLSVYNKRNDSSSATYMDYADRFADIVKRGTPTDDPNGMFVWLSWNDYDSSNPSSEQEPDCFLSFSDADQQALISLIDEMQTANLY